MVSAVGKIPRHMTLQVFGLFLQFLQISVAVFRTAMYFCLPTGQPMKCNLHIQGNVITSDQPILL